MGRGRAGIPGDGAGDAAPDRTPDDRLPDSEPLGGTRARRRPGDVHLCRVVPPARVLGGVLPAPARVALACLHSRPVGPGHRVDAAAPADGSDPDAGPRDVGGDPLCGAAGRGAPRPGAGPERNGPTEPASGRSQPAVGSGRDRRRDAAATQLGLAPGGRGRGGRRVRRGHVSRHASSTPDARGHDRRVSGDRGVAADRHARGRRRSTRITRRALDVCRPVAGGARRRARHRAEPGRARGPPRDRSVGAARQPVGPHGQAGPQRLHDLGVPRLQLPLLHTVQRRRLSRGPRRDARDRADHRAALGRPARDQHSRPRRPPARTCGTAARRLAGRPRPGPRGHLGPRPSAADGRRRGLVLGRHPCPRGLSQRDQHDLRRRSGRWPGRQRGVEPDRLARLPGGGGEVRRSARRAPRPGGAHDGRRRLHRDGSLPTARLATRARRPRRGDPARARLGPEARHVDQGTTRTTRCRSRRKHGQAVPTARGRLGA